MRAVRRFLTAFARAKQGLAALEFALLAPMMVILLLGATEIINALYANARAQNTAASLADVLARDDLVTSDEISGLWSAIGLLMYPDNAANMEVRVTSVSINDQSQARVVWSQSHQGLSALAKNSPVALPQAMLRPNTSVIMAETVFHYRPPLKFLFDHDFNIVHTAYRRSRLVDPIPCGWQGCS